jgi:hypothetical protein
MSWDCEPALSGPIQPSVTPGRCSHGNPEFVRDVSDALAILEDMDRPQSSLTHQLRQWH